MNTLRAVFASIFILVFALVALAATAGLAIERAITPQTASAIIDRAKVGERLAAALPGFVKQGMSGPGSSALRLEDIRRFAAAALPVDELTAMLRSISGEVVGYVRGEVDSVSKIDLAPIAARAGSAAKKLIPGKGGEQLAAMIEQQFVKTGLDKGLEVPREQLEATRLTFAQLRAGEAVAVALAVLALLLAFAVAPHGLIGRLRWCGIVLVVVGCLSAVEAVGFLLAPDGAVWVFGGNATPEIQSLIRDAAGVLAGILAMNIFIVAAVDLAVGIGSLVLSCALCKRRAAAAK